MSCISYRQLVPADATDFGGVEMAVFPEDPWHLDQIVEELTHPDGYYLGAWAETTLVGVGGIKGQLDLDLMTLGVLPGYRGQGIGQEIAAALVEHCRGGVAERVFLEVRESNQAAIGLYRRLGFEEMGKIRGYYRRPSEDAVTMRLLLSD